MCGPLEHTLDAHHYFATADVAAVKGVREGTRATVYILVLGRARNHGPQGPAFAMDPGPPSYVVGLDVRTDQC
jgi:hypothetical protein